MSERDLFIALLLASVSSGSRDPLGDTHRLYEAFLKQDHQGNIPV